MYYFLFFILFFLKTPIYANEIEDVDKYLLDNIEQEIKQQEILLISVQEEKELQDLLNRGEVFFLSKNLLKH